MEKDWPTLIVGGLFFLLGAIFCCVAAWIVFGDRLEAARLEAGGAKARAEVLRKLIVANRTTGSFVKPKHRIEYRFVPTRGEPVTAQEDIDPALWQRLGKGDAIEVAYLPADPSDHRIEGRTTDWAVALIFGLVGGFFAPVGFWVARNGLRGKEPDQPARTVRWINDNPPFALGSIGVVFFLIFAVAGVGWASLASDEAGEFARRAQAVEGMVIEKTIVRKSSSTSSSGGARSSSQSTHYHAAYRYVADGVEVLGISALDSDDWERLKERGPIAITYVGGAPWKHRVGDESGVWLWIGPAIFLGIGGLGMLGSGYALRRGWLRRDVAPPRQPKARPPQPAPAVDAPPASPAKPAGGNWIVWLVGAVFFAAGSSLAVSGLLDLLEERRFEADGQLVEARIVDKGIQQAERGERRSTAYTVTYRFTTKEGGSVEGRAVLKPDA
ncbi:MAG TPA: DUF3592 domain-containing protein, partial [Burkholderiales bacterium]